MAKEKDVRWLEYVEEHDYDAAKSYLRLIYDEAHVDGIISALRKTEIIKFKAKDIFRASRLGLLGISNSHVEKDRKKIRKGLGLSPLLLLRDEVSGMVIIADGYHRMCAVYGFDEDAWIHCKIIGRPQKIVSKSEKVKKVIVRNS